MLSQAWAGVGRAAPGFRIGIAFIRLRAGGKQAVIESLRAFALAMTKDTPDMCFVQQVNDPLALLPYNDVVGQADVVPDGILPPSGASSLSQLLSLTQSNWSEDEMASGRGGRRPGR
ncbi:hypothetical protein ON010_g1633 [Phytophthora cinnamomi]|nr:hypothetical protein ON010_g1633 [Phytophthora cinnamomi]